MGEDRIVLTVDLLFPIEQTISTFNMLGRRGGLSEPQRLLDEHVLVHPACCILSLAITLIT